MFLTGLAAADDQEMRPAETLDAFVDIGQGHGIVNAFQLAFGLKAPSVDLLALLGEPCGRGTRLADVCELLHNQDQVTEPCCGDGGRRDFPILERAVSCQEHTGTAEEFVSHHHRLAEPGNIDDLLAMVPIECHCVDKIAINFVL